MAWDLSAITQYIDIWLFVALFVLFIGMALALWHRLNIPIIIFFGTIAGGLAVWGSEFYNITMKSGLDYVRYGGGFTATSGASLIFVIGFFAVIIMGIINILISYRGNVEFWQ